MIGSDNEDTNDYDDTSDDKSITMLENNFKEDFFNEIDEIMDENYKMHLSEIMIIVRKWNLNLKLLHRKPSR